MKVVFLSAELISASQEGLDSMESVIL